MHETGRAGLIILGLSSLLLAAGLMLVSWQLKSGEVPFRSSSLKADTTLAASKGTSIRRDCLPADSSKADWGIEAADSAERSGRKCRGAASPGAVHQRTSVGKLDPTEPLSNSRSCARQKRPQAGNILLPPPPPTMPLFALTESSVCPKAMGSLPVRRPALPAPGKTKARAPYAEKVRLSAVVDDKVILTFPACVRSGGSCPPAVTLGAGEHVNSLSVIAVDKDRVILEENGRRSVKYMEPVH